MSIKKCQTMKTTSFGNCSRMWPRFDGVNFVRVYRQAVIGNNISKEVDFLDAKGAFLSGSEELVASENGENIPQMLDVFVKGKTKDENIIIVQRIYR